MMWQIGAMIVGLLLVSGASLWGINALHQDFGAALRGYRDLRTLYEVATHVATARALLLSGPRNEPQAARELQAAVDYFEMSLLRKRHETAEQSGEEQRITQLEGKVWVSLSQSLMQLRIWMQLQPLYVPPQAQVATLGPVYVDVTSLAAEIRKNIEQSQQAAHEKRRATMVATATVSGAVMLVAVLIGLVQYRSVTAPLGRLSRGVREFATGKFDRRIPTDGYAEFNSLARDLNHMASELESLYQQLEQKVAIKSRELVRSERLASVGYLAAGVAHEINNPLSIITGYAEMSLKRLSEAPEETPAGEAARALAVICEEAFRCKQITEKLLSLSRSSDENRKVISLAAVAQHVVSMVGGLPAYRDRRLVLSGQGRDDVSVLASEPEMKQVLLNLTVNALEAVEPGKGEVDIAVGRQNGWVELSVSDNGRGMSPQTVERVFEPFFTVKRGAGPPGTGLGLSITHAIVQNHGGRIEAHSAGPGRGSQFVVQLPAANGSSSAQGQE
jgi:signal transduction histidine kinase